jgi:hypothetical protein
VSAPDRSFSVDEKKVVAGTLIGFRSWRLTPDLKLAPIASFPMVWEPGVNKAVHFNDAGGGYYGYHIYMPTPEQDHTPRLACKCGFYGYFKNPLGISPFQAGHISGIVEAWGDCVVGDAGFRAQYAIVRALVRQSHLESTTVAQRADLVEEATQQELAAYYNVPLLASKEEAVEQYRKYFQLSEPEVTT